MKLALLSANKASQIANMHKLYLKEGTLAKLDENFLKDFYLSTTNEKNIFTVVASEGNEVLGFATGAVNLNSVPRIIIPKVARSFILAILKNPLIILKIAQMPFYPSFIHRTKSAEIFSIAVLPNYQGKGIGKSLIKYCRNEFKKKGYDNFLVSARDDMEANNFYKKIGLKKVKSTRFLGDKINFWQGPC
ncbi:MAG: N-acetyltransferase [Candidatus Curtissbacteria bacterium]